MTDEKHKPSEPELKYSGNFNLYFDEQHQIMFGAASHGGDKDIYIKKIVDRYNALAGIDKPVEWVGKMKELDSFSKEGDSPSSILNRILRREKEHFPDWQKEIVILTAKTHATTIIKQLMQCQEDKVALQAENEQLRSELTHEKEQLQMFKESCEEAKQHLDSITDTCMQLTKQRDELLAYKVENEQLQKFKESYGELRLENERLKKISLEALETIKATADRVIRKI